MASPTADIQAFAQSVYLTIKSRYFDDIEGSDGQTFVAQIIDWTNMFLDELESETDPDDGMPVDWDFARENSSELGTATLAASSITVPKGVLRLLTDEFRTVQIQQDSSVVSDWVVVAARDISSRTDRITQDMCAMVGTSIVFSRPFNDMESGGTITGDVTLSLPRLSSTNAKVLTQVKPGLLLKLGVAKNVTLPDIVQGGLSPSYTQKFNDLLNGAIARSKASSIASLASRDSYSDIRGIY